MEMVAAIPFSFSASMMIRPWQNSSLLSPPTGAHLPFADGWFSNRACSRTQRLRRPSIDLKNAQSGRVTRISFIREINSHLQLSFSHRPGLHDEQMNARSAQAKWLREQEPARSNSFTACFHACSNFASAPAANRRIGKIRLLGRLSENRFSGQSDRASFKRSAASGEMHSAPEAINVAVPRNLMLPRSDQSPPHILPASRSMTASAVCPARE